MGDGREAVGAVESLSRSLLVTEDGGDAVGALERLSRSPLVMGGGRIHDRCIGTVLAGRRGREWVSRPDAKQGAVNVLVVEDRLMGRWSFCWAFPCGE